MVALLRYFQVEVAKVALLGWVLLGIAGTVSARCTCSDVRPRFSHDGPPVPFGCYDQRRFGKCDEPFMLDTIEELAAGYCQISCGRCDCCSTFKELATSLGLNEMLEMMELAGLDPFAIQENPAWMASVLVPQSGAFSNWLTVQGWTYESVKATNAQLSILKDTIMLHILPPVEPILALWTTPFFQTGTAIPTSSQSVPTIYGYMDSISTGVSGDLNTVSIVNGNQEFCKGFIHVVDDVLLAYPLQIPPPPPPLAENSNSSNTTGESNILNGPATNMNPEASTETSTTRNQTDIAISAPPAEATTTTNKPQNLSPESSTETSITSNQADNTLNAEAPAETRDETNQPDPINYGVPESSSSSENQSDSPSPAALGGTENSPPELNLEPTEAPKPVNTEQGPPAESAGDSGSGSANTESASNYLG